MASHQVFLGTALVVMMISKAFAVEYAHAPSYHHEVEQYAHPQYSFQYEVKDDHTGDIKSQHETRDGDVVNGYYSLIQPDGHKRTVQYSSDHKTGFNAIVNYEGTGYHPAPAAPRYAPAPAYSHAPAPTYTHVPAPTYSHAPAPTYSYAPAPRYAPAAPRYSPAPAYSYAPAPVVRYSAPVVRYSPAPAARYAAPTSGYAAYATASVSTPHFSYRY